MNKKRYWVPVLMILFARLLPAQPVSAQEITSADDIMGFLSICRDEGGEIVFPSTRIAGYDFTLEMTSQVGFVQVFLEEDPSTARKIRTFSYRSTLKGNMVCVMPEEWHYAVQEIFEDMEPRYPQSINSPLAGIETLPVDRPFMIEGGENVWRFHYFGSELTLQKTIPGGWTQFYQGDALDESWRIDVISIDGENVTIEIPPKQ